VSGVRRLTIFLLVLGISATLVGPAYARAEWKKKLDKMVSGRNISVAVRDDGRTLYRWGATKSRIPASNQKLLLSMALLEVLPPDHRITTTAAANGLSLTGVVQGDLWVLGRGDPTITGGGRFGKSLPFRATGLGKLARKIKDAGVTRITGAVNGGLRVGSRTSRVATSHCRARWLSKATSGKANTSRIPSGAWRAP
jgi:D-alanyl-D-alanine carboxypeptidase